MSFNGIQLVKLSEIADVRDGTHDSPKQSETGKPLVTSKNIKNGKIDLNNTYLISLDDFQNINRRSKVDKWDILFSMIGTIGEMTVIDFEPDFAIKNVGLFKTNDPELSKWIYYYLKSPEAQNEIKASLKGSTQQYISLTDLRNFPIALPSKVSRVRITAILSNIDSKIDNNLATNQTLEEIARTLFKEWFVNFNYPNADGNLKHSEFGEIPENWSIGTLGDIYKTTSGGTPSRSKAEYYENGTIGWVKSKELNNSFIIDTEEKITEDALKNSSAKLLPKNSVLIAMYGATVGEIGITTKEFTCNQAICSFLPNDNYPFSFIYNFLLQSKQDIIGRAVGSAQQNISQQVLLQFKLVIPPAELVQEYHRIVFPLFQKIQDNIEENESLRDLRDSLLPKLMSGEIDVNPSNAQ